MNGTDEIAVDEFLLRHIPGGSLWQAPGPRITSANLRNETEVLGMRNPPSPLFWNRYPVTAVTALLAILVTLAWWEGLDVSFLFCDFRVSQGEIWRFVTS